MLFNRGKLAPACSFVLFQDLIRLCEGSQLVWPRGGSVAVTNGTSSSASSTSSVYAGSSTSSQTSSITFAPVLTSASPINSDYNGTGTITSAAVFPWGDQSIPDNECSTWASSEQAFQWTPCNVFAGTVQLSYFPAPSGNISYPSTYYNTDLGITMTSPSIYMAVNTIDARNDCGALGPTYVDAVVSMDLTDVYTLQPYANSAATTRIGPPQQLTLSDLATDCPKTSDISTDGAINNYHPVDNSFNRCNPRLQIPIQIKRLGYPYWKHCSNDDYVFGIYDPPGAVPPATNLIPTTKPTVVTATYEPASTVPAAVPDQASSTPASQATTPVAASTPVNSAASTPSADPVASPPVTYNPGNSDPSTPANTVNTPTTTLAGAAPGTVPGISPGVSLGNAGTSPANAGTSPANVGNTPGSSAGTPGSSSTPSQSLVAVVGSSTINVVAGSSNVVLPNGSTASVGAVVTLTGGGSPVTVSVGSSGVNFGGGGQSTYVPLPTSSSAPPVAVAIATIGSNVISAVPSATSVVIGSQTAYLNGPAVTQDGNAVRLTPTGVVVGNMTDGSFSTYNIPTQAAQPIAATPFATIGGQVISATPGATAVTINGQAVTSNGSPITLAGSNAVATLGSSGLIIQYSAGIVSSYALPTAIPTEDVQATVDGIPITAQVGVSTVIIGTQTLTVGGLPITLSGNQVATLGTGGLIIQAPGGVVSTVSMSATTSSPQRIGTLSSNSTTSSSKSTAAGTGSGTSQTGSSSGTSTTSTLKATSSMGGKIDIRRIFVLVGGFVAIGLIYGI